MASPAVLGKLSVRGFKPKTSRVNKERTKRKHELCKAFKDKNEEAIRELQDKCRNEKLSLEVVFYLDKSSRNKTEYRKDLDNLLKILMDVIKTEMDDDMKKPGLGLVRGNRDEDVFEITCRKELVDGEDGEGIDLTVAKHIPRESI